MSTRNEIIHSAKREEEEHQSVSEKEKEKKPTYTAEEEDQNVELDRTSFVMTMADKNLEH